MYALKLGPYIAAKSMFMCSNTDVKVLQFTSPEWCPGGGEKDNFISFVVPSAVGG